MITELYINWSPDLFALHLGSLGIRWYSLCWLIGLLGACMFIKRQYKDQGIPAEKFEPLFLYCFVGILIGARLAHCIFYQPDYFLTSMQGLIEMFVPVKLSPEGSAISNLFSGNWRFIGYEGLASHGGGTGMLVALIFYCRSTKLKWWTVLDNIAVATGFTAGLIRLGNLMNSEIIGRPTDMPWAFIFQRVDMLPRHPSQLYEAIAYLLMFAIMLMLYRTQRHRIGTGWFFGVGLIYIFIFRILIEFTKEYQEAFEQSMILDMGQLLSIPFIIAGIIIVYRSIKVKG